MTLIRSILLATVLSSVGAWAQPSLLGGGPPGMPAMMDPRERQAFLLDVLTSELGLSKTQATQVRQFIDQARQSSRPLAEEIRKTRRAIREAVKIGSPRSVLDGLHKQLAALHVELAEIETRTFADVWLLLRPEQRSDADIAYELLGAMILDLPSGPPPAFGGRKPPPAELGSRGRTP